MKFKFIVLFLIASLSLLGCSGDSGNSGSSTSAVSSAYSTATTKVNTMTALAPAPTLLALSNEDLYIMAAPSFGTDWTSSTSFIDERDSSSTNAKEWMGIQLDASAARANGSKISMFGRLADALQIFCAMGIMSTSTDSSGYPTTETITATSSHASSMTSDCGMSDASSLVGNSFTLTVSTPSDTTNFDRLITITLPAALGGGTQDFYIKSTSTAVNVGTIEINSNGLHRTVVFIDLTNNITRLEYLSAPNNGATLATNDHIAMYRMYYDGANDEGMMMALEFTEKGATDEQTKYVLAGKPQTSGAHFSLSMISTSLTDTTSMHEACVDASNGNITGDGARCTASSTDLNGMAVTSASMIASFLSGYNSTTYDTINPLNALSFSTSDFGTVALLTE